MSITAEQFLTAYAERSRATPEQVLEGRVVATCSCSYESCEGFQLVPENCVLEWRGDVVVIR